MQDQKSNLSIFSFKKLQRSFLKRMLVFFIPVVVLYTTIELLVLQIPLNYVITSTFFNSEKEEIEIMALGPSQTNSAINPEYFDRTTISLSSASQHHNLDFNILKQTKSRLPKLKYVILELSYAHLEHPHNSKSFWKNSVYLKYYDVNAFERNTYFKDKLIYLARPDIYSKHLTDHYIKKQEDLSFNKFGFSKKAINEGVFYGLNYNDSAIANTKFQIKTQPNLKLFKYNTDYLYKMLDYAEQEDLKVVVCTMPLYKTYLNSRNPEVVKRRDSILKLLPQKYKNLRVFDKESDSLFITTDYTNHNHLNPSGAEKFSKELNEFIQREFKD